MSKPLEKFLVYLSQTNDNCRETKSQWSEKILWRTATLLLNLYIRIKGGDKRDVIWNFIGGKLGRQEKAKWGNLCNCIKSKMERQLWLVWLSGLSAGLQTRRSPVPFPVRRTPGLQARCPAGGVWETTDQCVSRTLMFLSLSFCLLSLLSKTE